MRTAFDVGANIGATTRQLLRDFPRARVFAFEPVPDTFAQLQRNLGRHRRVSLHNLALGPAETEPPPSAGFLLADSSKFGRIHAAHFADLRDFEAVVTDRELPEEHRRAVEQLGVRLLLA